MSELIDTVQIQEIGDSLVELFDITLPDGSTTVHFINGLDNGTENIYFPIKDAPYTLNEYVAIPIQLDGISVSSSGAQNRPTLTTVNFPSLTRGISSNGDGIADEETLLNILKENGLYTNQDLLGSRVVYRRTLLKYTYKEGDTPSAPIEFPTAKFVIDRVSSEDNMLVAFELASPIDIEGVTVPNRVVIGKYCPWAYQGHEINYEGGCTWPTSSRNVFYDINDNKLPTNLSTYSSIETSYTSGDRVFVYNYPVQGAKQVWKVKEGIIGTIPSGAFPPKNPQYWYREDVCGKTINSCKIRFQTTLAHRQSQDPTDLDTAKILPFGGFPASRKFK